MIADFDFSENELYNLKKRSVDALILFGSRAQGLAGDKSDFDIGVIVNDRGILSDADKRIKTYDFLYELLSLRIKRLTNIDIVFLDTAPAELQAHVMKYGQPIFEAKKNVFANFRERVMEQYADFAPLREIFHANILSRIS